MGKYFWHLSMDFTSFGLMNVKMTIGQLLNSVTAGVYHDRNTIIINNILL